jgi:hypothetical protein
MVWALLAERERVSGLVSSFKTKYGDWFLRTIGGVFSHLDTKVFNESLVGTNETPDETRE